MLGWIFQNFEIRYKNAMSIIAIKSHKSSLNWVFINSA